MGAKYISTLYDREVYKSTMCNVHMKVQTATTNPKPKGKPSQWPLKLCCLNFVLNKRELPFGFAEPALSLEPVQGLGSPSLQYQPVGGLIRQMLLSFLYQIELGR